MVSQIEADLFWNYTFRLFWKFLIGLSDDAQVIDEDKIVIINSGNYRDLLSLLKLEIILDKLSSVISQ
jgi:hypothetical protein